MNTLLRYDLPDARRTVLGLFPELRRATMTAAVLARLTNDEAYTTGARELAREITVVIWAYVGVVQEARRETLGLGERLALCRLKQGVRDLALTAAWPTSRNLGTYAIELDQRALVALGRLREYDRLQGPESYPGDMAADILALADGTTFRKAQQA